MTEDLALGKKKKSIQAKLLPTLPGRLSPQTSSQRKKCVGMNGINRSAVGSSWLSHIKRLVLVGSRGLELAPAPMHVIRTRPG